MARVAVAMPVYNDERYLPFALDALAAQTNRDFHLTVVDDGCTDKSPAIVESYADRIPLTLIRAEHRGLRTTKRAAVEAAAPESEFLMIVDSDIALPPHAIARMIELLDADPEVAAVCAHARSSVERPWGRGSAFFEDLVRYTNVKNGETRWIVGGCVMFRKTVLEGIRLRIDINEDSDLSIRLRDSYKLLQPDDLVAIHYGVPTTVRGISHRGYRDGLRVRALMRAHPSGTMQLGSMSRVVPLPLALVLLAGVVMLQPWIAAGALAVFAAYIGSFLFASRHVPGDPATRAQATALFVISNLGYVVGFIRESFSKSVDKELDEPARSAQR